MTQFWTMWPRRLANLQYLECVSWKREWIQTTLLLSHMPQSSQFLPPIFCIKYPKPTLPIIDLDFVNIFPVEITVVLSFVTWGGLIFGADWILSRNLTTTSDTNMYKSKQVRGFTNSHTHNSMLRLSDGSNCRVYILEKTLGQRRKKIF